MPKKTKCPNSHRCEAKTKAGTQCKNQVCDSKFCRVHTAGGKSATKSKISVASKAKSATKSKKIATSTTKSKKIAATSFEMVKILGDAILVSLGFRHMGIRNFRVPGVNIIFSSTHVRDYDLSNLQFSPSYNVVAVALKDSLRKLTPNLESQVYKYVAGKLSGKKINYADTKTGILWNERIGEIEYTDKPDKPRYVIANISHGVQHSAKYIPIKGKGIKLVSGSFRVTKAAISIWEFFS